MSVKSKLSLGLFVLFMLAAIAILVMQTSGGSFGWLGELSKNLNREKVEISIVYAPESESYLSAAITEFNRQMAAGRNPVTGQKLSADQKLVVVTGESASSGVARTKLVNAITGVQTDQIIKPTIYAPSVGHWLRLVNYETGREVFKLDEARPTANAPVVIAIWESRLNLLKNKNPGQEIGWAELIQLLHSPNGWRDYAPAMQRQKVFYGHTDPTVSSTALSTLISTYYANAERLKPQEVLEQLTLPDVQNPQVRAGVKDIQKLIRHYSSRTTEFKEYIARGPDYLDFVALEENDLIYINQGKTEQGKPPEKLVALYPKEGTFMHEHPFAIPYANWVSQEQRAAAELFTEYVLTKEVQTKVAENGFRPVNPDVAFGPAFSQENGVDVSQPKKLLNIPSGEVIARVQQDWGFVKKQSQVILLVDTSGSMSGEKLDRAKEALLNFTEKMPSQDAVGLITFDSEIRELVPLAPLESSGPQIRGSIAGLRASGSTSLYRALKLALDKLQATDGDVIRAIVLLSDGQDTDRSGQVGLNEIVDLLEKSQNSDKPVVLVPIAYGQDADMNALNAMARASKTKVQSGDSKDIDKLLQIVASYF